MIDENKKVEIILYAKKGTAKVKHVIKPAIVCPYIPENQTPRLVIRKKIKLPIKAPPNLFIILFVKYLEINPIKIILPQVQKVKL